MTVNYGRHSINDDVTKAEVDRGVKPEVVTQTTVPIETVTQPIYSALY